MFSQLGNVRSWLRASAGLAVLSAALVLAGCSSSEVGASPPPAASESGAPAETSSAEPTPEPTPEASPEQQYCERAAFSILDEATPTAATAEEIAGSVEVLGGALPGQPLCSVAYVRDGARTVMTIWVGDETVAPALVSALSTDRFTATEEPGARYTISVFTDGDLAVAVAPVGVGNPMSVWSRPWPDDAVTLLTVTQP